MAVISLIIIAALTAVDQFTKMLIVTNVKPVGHIDLIPGFLEFRYLENTGTSFGLFPDSAWFFAIFSILLSAVIVVILFKYKQHDFFTYFGCITVVAGGIGNVIDRIMFGYVIDFIHFSFFDYIFNFADSCVVAGIIAISIHILFFMNKEKNQEEKVEIVEKEAE